MTSFTARTSLATDKLKILFGHKIQHLNENSKALNNSCLINHPPQKLLLGSNCNRDQKSLDD